MPTIYISFSAEINANTTENLLAFCASKVNEGADELYIMLSTPGGSVMHGLNIYNVLRALPAKIVMHNVGNVDSIGNVIFLAGEERYACPTSTFMFHGVGTDVVANSRLEEKILRERLDSIRSDQKRISQVLAEHSTISIPRLNGMFRQGVTKSPEFAKSVNIVHDIRDVSVPAGASVFQLVFQR